MSTRSTSHTVSPAHTAAPTAATTIKPARKAARKPPVIDRAGVTFGASPSPDATGQATLPQPSASTTPTTPIAPITAASPSSPATATTTPPAATPAGNSSATASSGTAPATSLPIAVSAAASAPAATATSTGPAAVDPSSVPFMSAPPTVTVPVPPAGFVPVRAVDLKGFRPMQSELASVPDAVMELRTFPNWALVFGITAEPADQIAQRMEVAAEWTALLAQSNDWFTYVKSQEGMAWKDGIESMESLKLPFQLASAANPSLLKQFPALGRLLGAQKVVAKRAASTKKKNAATAAATAATTATAAPAQTVTVTAPAAAATPARVVTVTG